MAMERHDSEFTKPKVVLSSWVHPEVKWCQTRHAMVGISGVTSFKQPTCLLLVKRGDPVRENLTLLALEAIRSSDQFLRNTGITGCVACIVYNHQL